MSDERTCPYCGELAADLVGEIAHMQDQHPDVIAQRLRDAGMHDEAARWGSRLQVPGTWAAHTRRLRHLADDIDRYASIPIAGDLLTAAVVELRHEVGLMSERARI